MFILVIVSVMIGTATPMLFKMAHVDPAHAGTHSNKTMVLQLVPLRGNNPGHVGHRGHYTCLPDVAYDTGHPCTVGRSLLPIAPRHR